MKKIISAAAVLAAMSVLSVSAFADSTIHVTISDDNGKLAVANEQITVGDADGDGSITINDALFTAHEKFFDGGADAGYGSAEGDYGLMLTKLWGIENGGSYGYYVNGSSAMSLADPINTDDYLSAFVYTDLTSWSDTYCYFTEEHLGADESLIVDTGSDFTVTLLAASFDENWSPITVPVEGAAITLNGEKTSFVTDADGKATITLPNDGNYVISAVSDTQTLVPPALVVTAEAPTQTEIVDDVEIVSTGDVAAATDSSKGSPDTGIADTAVVAGIAVLAAGAFALTRKRQ